MEFLVLLPFALLILGFVLVLLEVYVVPGLNVVGISGLLMMLFGTGLIFNDYGLGSGFQALGGVTIANYAMFYLAKKNGVWDKFILEAGTDQPRLLEGQEADRRAQYLGKTGVVLTPLRPTGIIEVDKQRIEVVTEGEFIAAGSKVQVVAMDRRRYFVRMEDEA
jgi:membrane-bound serine protease (ClpP class)